MGQEPLPSQRKIKNGAPDPLKLLYKRQLREQSSGNRQPDQNNAGMRIANGKNPQKANPPKKGFRSMTELLNTKL